MEMLGLGVGVWGFRAGPWSWVLERLSYRVELGFGVWSRALEIGVITLELESGIEGRLRIRIGFASLESGTAVHELDDVL